MAPLCRLAFHPFPFRWIIVAFAVFLVVQSVLCERAYPFGCSPKDPSYYDYDACAFPPPNIPLRATEDYLLVRRLGAGRFSDVYEAVDVALENLLVGKPHTALDPRTMVVIKARITRLYWIVCAASILTVFFSVSNRLHFGKSSAKCWFYLMLLIYPISFGCWQL